MSFATRRATYRHVYTRTHPLTYIAVALLPVRDFSRASVSIAPAEYASWSDARAELITEAKRPLKAQFEAQMSAALDETEQIKIRKDFDAREKQIEHEIDHKPLEMHISLSAAYNFLSK